MTTDDLLTRADEFDAWTTTETSANALVRDLASALLKERAIAEENYKSLSYALHVEQDRTHRYHERAERAEAALKDHLVHTQGCPDCLDDAALRLKAERDRDEARALLREARTVVLPAWVGASPKPTHLAITPERQSLADRIDALIGEKP